MVWGKGVGNLYYVGSDLERVFGWVLKEDDCDVDISKSFAIDIPKKIVVVL